MIKSKPNLFDEFARVTPDCPCPQCGRPDWCLIRNDGKACICSRDDRGKKRGTAGWLHYVKSGVRKMPPKTQKVYLNATQVQGYIDSISTAGNAAAIEREAKALGLSLESVIQMQARYDSAKTALVFPMFGHTLRPTGCRFRASNGKKWSLKGGREGVFISRGFRPDRPVFIAEGPTDSAALVKAGLGNVLGRPNCSGGGPIIRRLLERWSDSPVVIVADPDKPGIGGAVALADVLPNPTVVITGPTDIREFVSTSSVQAACRLCIIKGTGLKAGAPWVAAYRNHAGIYYNFIQRL